LVLGRLLAIGAAALLVAACATNDVAGLVSGPPPAPLATTASPAPYISNAPSFMESGAPEAAPSGFDDMCRRSVASCLGVLYPYQTVAANPSGATAVALTPARLALLERVNSEVNTRIISESDKRVHGVEEYWTDPLAPALMDPKYVAPGDCEDYALAKRDSLRARGWPAESMFLAVGYHRRYGLHVALIVRTDQGDLVLDSRSPWIRVWNDTPYIWTKRQVSGDSTAWVKPYATTPEVAAIAALISARAKGPTAAR